MKIYLSTAYTGNEKESFKNANRVAGDLMKLGHIVFSPISHTHPIAMECDMPKDWGFWRKFDECFIKWCDEVWICDFGDWKKSKGVNAEIEIAKRMNKTIRFIDV